MYKVLKRKPIRGDVVRFIGNHEREFSLCNPAFIPGTMYVVSHMSNGLLFVQLDSNRTTTNGWHPEFFEVIESKKCTMEDISKGDKFIIFDKSGKAMGSSIHNMSTSKVVSQTNNVFNSIFEVTGTSVYSDCAEGKSVVGDYKTNWWGLNDIRKLVEEDSAPQEDDILRVGDKYRIVNTGKPSYVTSHTRDTKTNSLTRNSNIITELVFTVTEVLETDVLGKTACGRYETNYWSLKDVKKLSLAATEKPVKDEPYQYPIYKTNKSGSYMVKFTGMNDVEVLYQSNPKSDMQKGDTSSNSVKHTYSVWVDTTLEDIESANLKLRAKYERSGDAAKLDWILAGPTRYPKPGASYGNKINNGEEEMSNKLEIKFNGEEVKLGGKAKKVKSDFKKKPGVIAKYYRKDDNSFVKQAEFKSKKAAIASLSTAENIDFKMVTYVITETSQVDLPVSSTKA